MFALNNILSVLRRLVLASTVYHIWIERNRRLFQNIDKSCDYVKKAIVDDVRLKLLSLRVVQTYVVREVAKI